MSFETKKSRVDICFLSFFLLGIFHGRGDKSTPEVKQSYKITLDVRF